MNERIERVNDRRKPVSRFCSCRHDPTNLRYGPYRVPRPSACEIEHLRFYCDDVAALDSIDIEAELALLVRRLALLRPGMHPVDHPWLLWRRARLVAARQEIERMDQAEATVPAMSEGVPKVRVVVVEVE